MNYQNRISKKYCIRVSDKHRKTSKLSSKWQIIYDKEYNKFKLIFGKEIGLNKYVFYSILNTNIAMNVGTSAAMIACNIIALQNKLLKDHTKSIYIDQWENSGKNIIVLQGYDHKHLKYLENESKFAALGTHATYQRWYLSRVILALSVFGLKEDIEDIFDGLSYLR